MDRASTDSRALRAKTLRMRCRAVVLNEDSVPMTGHRIAVASVDARCLGVPSFRILKALVFTHLHTLFAAETLGCGASPGAAWAVSEHSTKIFSMEPSSR